MICRTPASSDPTSVLSTDASIVGSPQRHLESVITIRYPSYGKQLEPPSTYAQLNPLSATSSSTSTSIPSLTPSSAVPFALFLRFSNIVRQLALRSLLLSIINRHCSKNRKVTARRPSFSTDTDGEGLVKRKWAYASPMPDRVIAFPSRSPFLSLSSIASAKETPHAIPSEEEDAKMADDRSRKSPRSQKPILCLRI